jgi:hypothetical protein
MVSGLSGADLENACIVKLNVDPAQVKAVIDQARKQLTLAAETPAWFGQNHAGARLTCVAYFSMEFMLSEAFPIYSGGLGNVAGDQLKASSDLGVPVVGVGLLYQQGYFRQVIDKDPLAAMIRSTGEKTMKKSTEITCLFLDIGGVMLTNGWEANISGLADHD